MTPRIKKGIPLPPTKPVGNRNGNWVTLLTKMKRGDSVMLASPPMPTIYALCKRRGWKVRIQYQGNNHGCRSCNHPGNIVVALNGRGVCSRCNGTRAEEWWRLWRVK